MKQANYEMNVWSISHLPYIKSTTHMHDIKSMEMFHIML
jgi:hypothetical protein